MLDTVTGSSPYLLSIFSCALALSSLGCPQLLDDQFSIRALDAGNAALTAEDCVPFALCAESCVDVQSDRRHCGGCAAAIQTDQICSLGQAISASNGCGPRTLCEGGCVDLQTHPFYCGGCTHRCKPGARCTLGRCACAPPAAKDCGSACRACCADSDCPVDQGCSDGVCLRACAAPNTLCSERCVSIRSDAKNCGRCGNDCGVGKLCTNGLCTAMPMP